MSQTNVRQFETGATRSADAGRYDPEGFLAPIVIERYCEYMQKHRIQPDGSVRSSDNWQKGLSPESYMKGLQRHNLHAWTRFRGYQVVDPGAAQTLEEDLCAIIFNARGLLFELLKERRKGVAPAFARGHGAPLSPPQIRDLTGALQDVQRSLEATPFPPLPASPNWVGVDVGVPAFAPGTIVAQAGGAAAQQVVGVPYPHPTMGQTTLADIVRQSEGGDPD